MVHKAICVPFSGLFIDKEVVVVTRWFRHLILLFFTLSLFPECYANVVIDTTRVIYPVDKKEVIVTLSNPTSKPYLVQSWLDDGDESQTPSEIQVPFAVLPPISRIDGGKGQTLRIFYSGEALPQDRESVFWLNVLAVPGKPGSDENYLQFAFNNRIKLFFRPADLAGNANSAPGKLRWIKTASGYQASNPTPYYISLTSVVLTVSGEKYKAESKMIAPFTQQEFSFVGANLQSPERKSMQVKAVNDHGAVNPFQWNVE